MAGSKLDRRHNNICHRSSSCTRKHIDPQKLSQRNSHDHAGSSQSRSRTNYCQLQHTQTIIHLQGGCKKQTQACLLLQ